MQVNIIEPNFKSPLPPWGEPIINYLRDRILVSADQLNRLFWSKGSRKGKKKLYELSRYGYLLRYEIETSQEHQIAYTLGPEGMKLTKRIIPDLGIRKAQEILIANKFIDANGISDFNLWVGKTLLIGDVVIDGNKYALWCPIGEEVRTASLNTEVGVSYAGLIVVAPTLKFVYDYNRKLKGFFSIYYTTQNLLTEFL